MPFGTSCESLGFGSASGILGTIGAAIVFAELLFEPAFSLRVSDSVQRNNLVGWSSSVSPHPRFWECNLGALSPARAARRRFRGYNSGNFEDEGCL